MKLFDLSMILGEDLGFSLREIEKAIFFIVLAAFAVALLAMATFAGEYLSGYGLERLLEFSGVLKKGWMVRHGDLFLHEIQTLFIVTFFVEIILIISRYMRGWKL